MSYILDALKKSDHERRQGDVPDLRTVHIPVAQEAGAKQWPYFIIFFLLLSLAFVIGMLKPWENHDEKRVSVIPSENQQAIAVSKTVASNHESFKSKSPEVKLLPDKTPVVVAKKNEAIQPDIVQQERPEAVLQDYKSIPHLYEMPESLQQTVPKMSFAGHVYSTIADQRSVIVNDQYMNEGDEIVGGLKIEKITREGLVFLYNDKTFRMDVLQDWSFD